MTDTPIPSSQRLVTLSLPQRIIPSLAGCVLAIALVFGGGTAQGLWADAAVELASLPLLAVAAGRLFRWGAPGSGGSVLLLAATLLLPVLQLIPLPPEWWTQLPGRAPILSAYDAIGIAHPWLPLSLTPAATMRGALSLVPPTAIFLATIQLDQEDRRRLILMVLAFVLVSVVVDFLQTMNGPTSPLYFYEITNKDSAVGFFANRNHNAALLYSAIPLAAAWGLGLSRGSPGQRVGGAFVVGLVVVGVVASLAIVASRAGVALGFLAGLFCIALAATHRSRHRRRTVLIAIGGNLLALLLAFQFGFVALAGRIGHNELIEDIRLPVAMTTIGAAEAYDPFGAGFGSFVPIFQSVEPRNLLATYYVNHAHDDWLELWLGGGIPAVVLAAVFLLWFCRAAFRVWRARYISTESATLARAASVVILLLLLHSVVDYPLRTTALMAIFAFCVALMIVPPDGLVAARARTD